MVVLVKMHRCDGARRRGGPRATARTLEVAAMFGLGLGEAPDGARPPLRVPIRAGAIVLIAGPSGAGKTTLLRGVAGQLRRRGVAAWRAAPETSGRPDGNSRAERGGGSAVREAAVIDAVGAANLQGALGCLARAGLSDAHVLLRQVGVLSEGERFRFALRAGMPAPRRYCCATSSAPRWMM